MMDRFSWGRKARDDRNTAEGARHMTHDTWHRHNDICLCLTWVHLCFLKQCAVYRLEDPPFDIAPCCSSSIFLETEGYFHNRQPGYYGERIHHQIIANHLPAFCSIPLSCDLSSSERDHTGQWTVCLNWVAQNRPERKWGCLLDNRKKHNVTNTLLHCWIDWQRTFH